MASKLPIEPRWILGIVAVVVVGALMAMEVIETSVGLSVLVSVLAGLGVYERQGRRKAEKERDA